MVFSPCLVRSETAGRVSFELGHRLLDEYLRFVASPARPNTLRAVAHDLKTFFAVVGKAPTRVTPADVFAFVRAQHEGEPAMNVVRLDGSAGVSARTIRRRLSSVSGLYAYLVARGVRGVRDNPVPRGLATRRDSARPRARLPLIRTPRTLPRILAPAEVDGLVGALRTGRDRAMVEAMLLGGLRRCEVLGLRLEDLRIGERRVFIVDGKGGHQRLVPISGRFFTTVGRYLDDERPAGSTTDRVFVVLKGPNRGRPLSAEGLDEILAGARRRAGLAHATCHELRHTCMTRLQPPGVASGASFAGVREVRGTRACDAGRAA